MSLEYKNMPIISATPKTKAVSSRPTWTTELKAGLNDHISDHLKRKNRKGAGVRLSGRLLVGQLRP